MAVLHQPRTTVKLGQTHRTAAKAHAGLHIAAQAQGTSSKTEHIERNRNAKAAAAFDRPGVGPSFLETRGHALQQKHMARGLLGGGRGEEGGGGDSWIDSREMRTP